MQSQDGCCAEQLVRLEEAADGVPTDDDVGTAGAPSNRWPSRTLFAKVTALIAAVGLVALGASRSGVQSDKLANVESDEITQLSRTSAKTAEHTGCSNWAQIALGDPLLHSTVEKCAKACIENEQCVMFNFQRLPNSECLGGAGPGDLSCTLWSGQCVQEANKCFDLYSVSSDSAKPQQRHHHGHGRHRPNCRVNCHAGCDHIIDPNEKASCYSGCDPNCYIHVAPGFNFDMSR
eukprot:TRINITY_DN28967_c0_g1_i1.p1 TRINITY_DN28967_c0_g1~~TRINITY_DN28967_c0_g1_i1.p1  ORF type:complete len:234 (+),score=32.67 TRINITY_DN28967_c0_g1_i1:94-795(+)